MSGDIGNAFERLRRLLPKIKYHGSMDQAMAVVGAPEVLLPLLHYIFLGYSRDVARFVSNAGYELMGKTDMQFVSDCFRMLSDLFAYNPSVSSKQFLARGFAERKLHMVSDIILLVIEKRKRLAPVQHLSMCRRSLIQPAVVRTVVGSSDNESSPSPRLSAPPIPTAKLPLKPTDSSLDVIAKLSERIASLETTMRSISDTMSARITIMEGKIRYMEQKWKSQEPVDREEQEQNREIQTKKKDSSSPEKQSQSQREQFELNEKNADHRERTQSPVSSYPSREDRDMNSSIPVTFADRMNVSGSGESLRNAFSVLSQTTDSMFVQNLLTRVEQTDLLFSSQFRPVDSSNVRPSISSSQSGADSAN